MTYIEEQKPKDELTLYFMPETAGPCRFGQYNNFVKNYLEKEKIGDVALLSLSADNGYAGVGTRFALRAWQGIIIDEVLEEIYSNILVLAKEREKAVEIYNREVDRIVEALSTLKWKDVKRVMRKSVEELSKIELKMKLEDAKKVALVGEIYVRRDSFSKSDLVEKLAQNNIILKIAPASEWIYYCDYIVKKRLASGSTEMDKYRTIMITWFKEHYEKRIKNIFGTLEFYEPHFINIDKIIESAQEIISPKLTGESVLTVGAAINDIVTEVSGIINIGPFGCMPSRIAEAILNEKLEERKIEMCHDKPHYKEMIEEFEHLPFLTIEVDGAPFTQLVEAKLDSFYLQVDRVHSYNKSIKN
jgi:predicted nucleotide-binding protein (sugar kinase/HSP70/actin superfamily)